MIVIGLAFPIKIPVILHSGYFNNARKTSVLPATSNVLKSKKKVLVLLKPETPVKFIIDLARSELLKLKEADLKQGQESRRESISNRKTYNNTTGLSTDQTKKYFNTTEILNREALPLRQEYKEKVQYYFKKNND